MREIKFRAKHINGDLWVLGSPYKFENKKTGEITCLMLFEDERNKPIIHKINPETIGEFTGLLDKNGKEIYEGDIIEFYGIGNNYNPPKIAFISYSNEHASFVLNGLQDWPCRIHKHHFMKVIGNIYENPELLEKIK